MRRFIFFIFGILLSTAAQSQLAPGKLLASAWDDPSVQAMREQQAYLDGHDFKLPLLRQLQVRTETRDWDPKQQEYAVRLSPNTPGMKRTQADIYHTMKVLTAVERQALVLEALAARYEVLIDAFFAEGAQKLMLRQKQVLADKRAVYAERLKLGLETDLDDYFRAEEDLLELERRLEANKRSRSDHQMMVEVLAGTRDTLRVDSLVEVSNLLIMLNLQPPLYYLQAPSAVRRQVQSEIAQLEAELERKDAQNPVSYLQFGYTGNANDPTNNRFKVGAGVNLPWPNASRRQVEERELRALEAAAETKIESEQKATQALSTALTTGNLIEELELLEQQRAQFAEQYDPARLQANGLNNPETLLRVQESLLRLEWEALALKKDIYQAFVAHLTETGLLVQEPARNWLSPSMELIAR